MKSADNTKKIFVYGTLKRGKPLAAMLNGFPKLVDAYLKGYAMYSQGAFPVIVHRPAAACRVWGEVYNLPNATIAVLDRIEGAPYTYNRELVQAWGTGQDSVIPCECYVYQRPVESLALVPNGRW